MERIIKSVLYAGRWILAPIYLGLMGALIAILIKFYIDLFHLLHVSPKAEESSLILSVLGLIDLTLIGGLLVMVMLSSYENFISKSVKRVEANQLDWLSMLDANELKLKVAAAIVAISSIHLLQVFMSAGKYSNSRLVAYIALHLTFVLSACLMGLLNSKPFERKRNP